MNSLAIQVEGLRFNYDQGEVLHGLTFQLRVGEVLGLLGANGAGKSTTLKILAGILSPSSGKIRIQGFTLPEDRDPVKRLLGYVPENAALYESLSAKEFLVVPAIRFWGWRDALLFVIFSASMASLYLSTELFLMDGLPFANPVRLSAQAFLVPVMFIGTPCAAILAFLQWLLFRNHTAASIATVSVFLLAVLVTRFSLRHLASEFRANLLALGLGPSRLFKPIDSN